MLPGRAITLAPRKLSQLIPVSEAVRRFPGGPNPRQGAPARRKQELRAGASGHL